MIEQSLQSRWISPLGLKGTVKITLWGKNGEIKDSRYIKDQRYLPNTVTTFGDKLVANLVSGDTLAAPSHMAVGTGTGGGTGNQSLENELDRNALTSTTQDTGAEDNNVVYVGDWAAADGTGALTEAGIFNHGSNPGLFVYSDFSAINKGASDTLQITWTVTFGSS